MMAVRELTMTMVVFGSRNSSIGGELTSPKPKPTVPSTMLATKAISSAKTSSTGPVSSVPRSIVSESAARGAAPVKVPGALTPR